MPITPTQLLAGGSNVNATSYSGLGSISPTANRVLTVFVASRQVTGGPNLPTLTGNGLTYELVTSQAVAPRLLSLWRAATGSSPSAGNITYDFGADTQETILVSVIEWEGVLLGNNGADAIVQTALGTAGSGTTASATLASFADAANNVAAGAALVATNVTIDPGAGFTAFTQPSITESTDLRSEWKLGEDLVVDMTWSVSVGWAFIAMEMAMAGGAAGIFSADALFLNRMKQQRNVMIWG